MFEIVIQVTTEWKLIYNWIFCTSFIYIFSFCIFQISSAKGVFCKKKYLKLSIRCHDLYRCTKKDEINNMKIMNWKLCQNLINFSVLLPPDISTNMWFMWAQFVSVFCDTAQAVSSETMRQLSESAIAAMHGPHSVFNIGHCTVKHCDSGAVCRWSTNEKQRKTGIILTKVGVIIEH